MANPSQRYIQAETKGRQLFQRLEQRLYDAVAKDVVRGSVEINYHLDTLFTDATLSPELETAFFNENIDLRGWNSMTVFSKIKSSDPAYSNLFCPAQGGILCVDNNKMHDKNESQDRLEWSEVVFQLYQMEAARTLEPIRNLRTVWRFFIVSPDTRSILGEAKSYGGPREAGPHYTEYRRDGSNDSGFFALLGCPNGNGIVRMLIDHCDALGHKTIVSVRAISTCIPPIMYFILDDCNITSPVKKSQRSRAGQERAAKAHQNKAFRASAGF